MCLVTLENCSSGLLTCLCFWYLNTEKQQISMQSIILITDCLKKKSQWKSVGEACCFGFLPHSNQVFMRGFSYRSANMIFASPTYYSNLFRERKSKSQDTGWQTLLTDIATCLSTALVLQPLQLFKVYRNGEKCQPYLCFTHVLCSNPGKDLNWILCVWKSKRFPVPSPGLLPPSTPSRHPPT